METAVILTNGPFFLSGKNPLPFYHPNHCRKIAKSTVTKGLKLVQVRGHKLSLRAEHSTLLPFGESISICSNRYMQMALDMLSRLHGD